MAKEMIISSSAHEKKIAIIENGIVTEYFVEREDETQGVVGSIYKGRVMKVLPGMQSAFVDIGLGRDAFLYVSDFLEEEGFDELDALEDKDTSYKEPVSTHHIAEPVIPKILNPVVKTLQAIDVEDVEDVEDIEDVEDPEEEMSIIPLDDSLRPESKILFVNEEIDEIEDDIETKSDLETAVVKQILADDDIDESAIESTTNLTDSTFEEPLDESIITEIVESPASEEILATAPIVETVTYIPQVIISPPTHDFIRISDEPEDIIDLKPVETNANLETTVSTEAMDNTVVTAATIDKSTVEEAKSVETAEVTEVEVAEVVEEEPAPNKRRRTSRKEPAKKKAPARRKTKKASEAEESVEEISASSAVQCERIMDEDAIEAGEMLKEALIQNKIIKQLREEEENPVLEAKVILPPVKAENNIPLERIVDEDTKDLSVDDSKLSDDLELDGGESDGENWQSKNSREPGHKPHFRRSNNRRRRRGGPPPPPRPPANYSETAPASTSAVATERPEVVAKEAPGRFYPPAITDLLREGQEIVVQIAKEPIALKGARITSHIALPGRYIVYMPTVHHIGVSRKISSDAERLRLKKIMLSLRDKERPQGGFIVRTACEGHTEQELYDDMMYLVRTWQDIKKKAEKLKAPALIAGELDLVQRTLRDQLSDDIVSIRIDNEEEYTKVVDFISRFQPKLVKKVKLYTWKKPIFEEYGVQEELDKAIKPRVWLPSGGYIVINQTEALVAIDVNTGKYVGKSNRLEDTITKINIEAVKEIVRQIRLRDLGGIIVLDLIDMEERRNRFKVMQALEQELKADRSPSKVLQFNDFGLVAITRKRVRQSLERTLCCPCPYCEGSGLIKSPQTICYEILVEARKFVSDTENLQASSEVTLRVHPEVANALRSTEKKVLAEIEAYLGCNVVLRGDNSVHQERYDFAIR